MADESICWNITRILPVNIYNGTQAVIQQSCQQAESLPSTYPLIEIN